MLSDNVRQQISKIYCSSSSLNYLRLPTITVIKKNQLIRLHVVQLLTMTLEMTNFDIFRTQYCNSPDRARFDLARNRLKLTTFLIINEIVIMSI